MSNFKNMNFVITGAASYLTSHIVNIILSNNGKVFALDINYKKLLDINNKRKQFSNKVKNIEIDITNEEEVKKFSRSIYDTKIDVLINSAAAHPLITSNKKQYDDFTNYPFSDWKKSIDVNINGMFLITKYICKNFEKKNQGNIINIASTYGLVAPDQRMYDKLNKTKTLYKPLEYSVSKNAVIGFTKSLAAYYQGTNIRVNSLSPGGIEQKQTKEFKIEYSKRTLTGRMSKPNDYDQAILFLCSKKNLYMTGSNLIVDGGWTAI